MPTAIVTLTAPQIEACQTQIIAVYRNAFTSPPYNKPEAEVAEFAGSFLNQFDRDGYRFVAALESDCERLVGLAYGYSSTAGRWWYEHAAHALPELVGSAWLEDSFQLVEIALDPELQGQGIGGRLHDHLLAGIRHDRAILATLQGDTAAFRLYRSRGWVVLAQDLFFPRVPRRYQVMGIDLRHRRA